MKIRNKFLIVFVCSLSQIVFSQIWNKTKISGNNKEVTQQITTQKYDKINVSGSIDVELVRGNEGSIILEAEENLIEYIEIYCKNNTLTIKIRNNTYIDNNKQIKVLVPLEEISEVSLAGSSTIVGRDAFEMENLEVSVAGSGEMSINITAQKLVLNVVGSGTLGIKGTTQNCTINVAGSGNLQGERLICKNVVARVAGSGVSIFTCNETLKAYVIGSGSIQYKGNPKVLESKVVGSGSVENIR